ncbi:leucine-rich repeat transmembrane protein CCDC168 [Manis javanica]|uniref:leucine-rich repeat transmembrane protein CCDC168 n=1 Tax=Manis javanica TaxID=9974 RepID=UPI003C6CEC85
MYNGKKVETDMPWKTGFSHKQQKQSLGGESTWWADYRDRWARASGGVRDVKGKGGEAALPRFQHLSFNAHNVTEAAFVKSGLEQKNPARKTGPESVTTAQELPQQAPPTQCGSQSVNCSILNSLPSEKLPKRTKTQKGLKDPKILSPEPGKSVSESVIVTAQSDILSERGPRKKPAASILEEKRRLQKDLQASTLESFDFSMPASSEFIMWRNAAQIPEPRTGKAQRASVSEMMNTAGSGALSHGREQDCLLENMARGIPQGIKVHSTPKPRVKIHNHTYFRDREAWKASVTDTQNRYSNTMRMYVQHEKEEENIQKTLPESVPHYSQNFSFSAHRMKNLGHCKSESKLKSSAVRRTCNAPCTVEKTRQEKHIRETIWETVSRQVMNLLQVETVKNNTHTQKGIKWMVGLKTPSPKAGKSETGSMQCDTLWDRNPGRKSESPISEQKAWNESDLARTVLKPLAFSSLDSFVPQSQSYTEFVGKESMRPKHATLKEKKLLISQLLNGKRSLTGSPEKKCKRCKFKQRTKERRWEESVAEAFICAAKGVGIPLPILMSETHPFSTVARGVLCNRTHHKDLNGLITEEKAGLEEILAATYVGSLDFFMPVVSDSESQINTVHLSEKKIILNPQHLTLKKKEPPVSQIPKLNRQLTIRQRGELGSHFKTKMKGLKQGKHVADTFPKTISSPWDAADIESRFKTETDRVSRSRHVQPPQMGLPAEGPVSGQSLSAPGHAAFSMNEEQEEKTDGEREKTVLNADLQSIHTSMLVPPHTRMDRSPGTWGNHEESSEKRNILNKVKVMEKQKYEQHGLFRTAPRYTQASEFGACRMRESGPAESQEPLINTVCPTGTTPQKTDIDLIDQETNIKVVEHLSPECVSFSKIHLLEIEKQQEEFKTANWETVANPKNLALHDKHPEPCVSGTLWSAPYAHTPVYPKTIKHKAKAETADVKNTMHTKQVKLEAQELPASHLFKTTGYGTRRNTKKLRSNIKSRKEEFKEGKTAADLALNTVCESRCTQSPVKEFMEIKREKDKPRERICIPAQVKLEKSLNRRNRPPLQFSNKSATSRNPKKLKQCVREQKEKRQIVLQDIVLQCRDQVVISQPVKEEDNHIKLVVNLEREAYPDLFPWKRRTSYSRLDNPRIRILTDCKFLIAQRVQEGDADIVPQGREESEKTAISLHAKEQNMFLAELDASQQKTCEEQELLKRESISMTNQGSISYLKTIPPHLENVVKVAEEDMYINRENIPQLLRREKLKTDILQGSKGQKYLYTNLEIQQNMSAVRKGEVKPNHIPERILDSTSCLRRGPLHAQEAVNTRKKENISIPVSLNVNCWGKKESKLTDNQLKANGQKVNLSKKLRVKQVHSSNQNEETILGVISSCILHHLNIEQLKKEGSAQGMSSKFLSQMVEKASNKADFPGDPPPCSMRVNLHTSGRKKYQKESTGKGLPTSVSRSPMAVLKITLPCVGKSQKAAERPKYHTANTEGSGLPIEGKTERLECIPQILPNPNSNPLRDRFQNKMPSRKKSSEEAVSTAECTPHAEGIGSLLTGKEEQQEKCAYEALPKPASHSKTGLREMNTPGQQVKLDTNVMHCEYSTPQAAEPLKGMDVIAEYTQKSKTRQNLLSMEQNKQHLLNPHKNFLEHMFYSPNDPQLLQHVTPQTKKALPEVGSISSRTKGLDLFPKDQPNTVSEDGPEWTVPSIPLRQKKNQNTMLPLGSYSKTIKHLTASFPEGSTSSNEARVIRLLSNSGSHKLRVRRKVGGTAYQRVQAMCLPGIFLHSVSTYMPILPGTKRQEDSIKQGVTKGITYPLRTLKLKESVFSNALNSMDYVIPSSRPVPQWDINEKMVNVKHRKGQPDTVVTNPFEFISPLPHLKLSKETTDGIISNNVKTIKQCMSQRKEDRIKEGSRREIMNPNVILKAKKPSVSRVLNGMELPVLLNTLKQECKAQTGKGESGGELTKFCTFLPPLSHPNLDLRIKVGKGKSGIPRSCLLPPKLQASTNIRKTSSAESMNRDSLSSVIGSKQYLPQKKREVRGHTVNVKDKMDLQHISPKGKKTSIKPTLLGKESQWNNKEREKRMQKEKSDVGIVQRKSHAAIPPSPHVEGGPGVEEEIHIQGITGFCLPSLTLRELADEMGTGKEPTDDILSSIRKAKHLPQQDGDRVPMALEEMRRPQRRAASKAGRPVTAQGLQLNVRDRNNQAQEDERVVIQSKSCASISLPPYSEVETRRKGEAMLIKTRSSFLQLELHESSDTGKKASKKPIYYDMSNSVKKAKEHIMQDKEERVKMAKVTPLKKKESPILWEIQLDSKEQEKKIQKFKGEPSMVPTNTNTCMPAPSHLKWERGIKKTDHVTKITRDSLPELSPQRSDSVKKTNKKCTEGGGTGDTQEAGEDVPQGEEADGKTAAGRAALHPRDKDVKGKNMLPQATPLNPKEGGTGGPEGDRQGEMDPKGKGQGTEDGEGRGEWEAVLPTERPSEFSLAYHESETEGKEDTLKGTGPATSQPWLQTSVDAGQLAEPQAVRDDMKAIQKDKPQEEEERGNTAHMKWVPHPRGTASKAETSPPPPVSSVAEPRALSKKKEAQWSSKEKEQKQGRTGEPDVGLTKTPSAPSPSHDRVDTGTQGDTDLLAVFSPSQLQPPKSAGAGKLRYAESNGNTSPCNRILKANPCAISEDNRRRLHTRHQKMSLEGTDTIKLNSKHKSPEDSSPTRRMETLTVNVLSGKKKPITKLQDTGVSTGFEKAEPSDGLVLTPDFQQNPQQLHDPSLSTICHCGSIGVLQNLTPEHLPACILSRDRRSSTMFAGEGRLPPSAPALPALQLYLHGHFCSGLLGAPLRGRQGSPVGRGD